jgi:DNA-binding beta-propeller fold protein YncE
MPCTICGKEGRINDSGLCEVCAGKLKRMSESSDILQKTLDATLGEGKLTTETGSDNKAVPVADTAKSKSSSHVVAEFGEGPGFKLHNPFSVALGFSANILVMDRPGKGKYRVSSFAPDGTYLKTVLQCDQGSGPNQLKYPKGIAIDAQGNIYIPDAGNHRIQRFDAQGTSLGPIGSFGEGPGQFNFPCDIDIDDTGSLYTADTYNNRIQKLTPQGLVLLSIGSRGNGDAGKTDLGLEEPSAVTVDKNHNIFVADTSHHRIVEYDSDGHRLMILGSEGTGRGELTNPSDVRVQEDGSIYVADRENSRVQKFSPEGICIAEFSLETSDSHGGVGGDVAVDSDGYLLVCNMSTHKVVRVELFDSALPHGGTTK